MFSTLRHARPMAAAACRRSVTTTSSFSSSSASRLDVNTTRKAAAVAIVVGSTVCSVASVQLLYRGYERRMEAGFAAMNSKHDALQEAIDNKFGWLAKVLDDEHDQAEAPKASALGTSSGKTDVVFCAVAL